MSITVSGLAQEIVYEVHGTLTNPDGYAIQYAHVVNINRRTACITNDDGRFRMLMLQADTIKISCLGYETTGFSLSNFGSIDDDVLEFGEIVMQPKIYQLKEVDIYAERWKSFVYDYKQIEIKEAPYYEKQIENWRNNLISSDELRQLTSAARGFGISVDWGNIKRRKAEKKIEELERQEEIADAAYKKYNPKIISSITGLSLEESEKFILHFNLNLEFIARKNDYDIRLLIKQLYQEYSKINK